MLSLGVLAGQCLPLFSMLQTRLHKKWELTHVNCTLPMSIPLQNVPGSVHFLKPSGSLSFSFFFVFCPQSTAVMCRKLGLSKFNPSYWKQNSTFVSLFCMWKRKRGRRGCERAYEFLLAYLTSAYLYVREFFNIAGVHSYTSHNFPFQLQSPFIYYYNWYILSEFYHFVIYYVDCLHIDDLFPLVIFDSSLDILEHLYFLVFRFQFKCHLLRKDLFNLAETFDTNTLNLFIPFKFLLTMISTWSYLIDLLV